MDAWGFRTWNIVVWLRRWLWPLAGVLGLGLALGLSQHMAQFDAACGAVRQNTLRLHIRAASDSVADQAAKLRVRDAVLQLTEPLYAAAEDADEAKAVAARSLPRIALTAAHTLWQQGNRQTVSVFLTNEYFESKIYGEYTLPPGHYDALRIELGRGAGQNWWCCLYPQLCLAACAGYDQPGQQALVVGDYELRFRVAEWWQKLTGAAKPADLPCSVVCTAG